MNDRRKKTYYGPNDDSCHLGRIVHKVAHLWPQVVLPVLCLLLWESALTVWGCGKREERVGSIIVVNGGGVGRWSWCYGWCWCDVMFNIHHVMCRGWAENYLWVNNYNTNEKSPFLGWKKKLNICNPEMWKLSSHSDWKQKYTCQCKAVNSISNERNLPTSISQWYEISIISQAEKHTLLSTPLRQ